MPIVDLGSELEMAEAVAKDYGFRLPRLDESPDAYEAELMAHVHAVQQRERELLEQISSA